jgi:hypothetical protein
METIMNQTDLRSRIVVSGSSAPTTKKTGLREPAGKRVAALRIVVIRNGEFVVGRPGR